MGIKSMLRIAGLAILNATGALGTASELPDAHLLPTARTADEQSRISDIVAPTTDFTKAERFEVNQAGAATVRPSKTTNAFSQASANISFERELDFKVGNGLFKKLWVSAPSSTLASDGLGPLYAARSCQRCRRCSPQPSHAGPDPLGFASPIALSVFR